MSEVAELDRQIIADMEQEDFDKLKEQVTNAEEGEEITIGDPEPEEKAEDPEPEEKEEEKEEEAPEPEEKKEDPEPEEKEDDQELEINQLVDQYLSDVQNKQDLSKYTPDEMQNIIHVQNKRLKDKDGFIDTLKVEKKQERQKLNETINIQKAEYEEKLKARMSRDELNELHQINPMEAIETQQKYKDEDKEAEQQLLENNKKEKRLYNEEQLMVIDRRSDFKFQDLVPEMKQVLKGTNSFTDDQIEAFAKDPYLEDLEVLLELRDRAVELRGRQAPKATPNPEPSPGDKTKKEIEEKKKIDLATKINKAQRTTNTVRGGGSKTPDADLAGNLKQTSYGKHDLSSLSREDLAKLKKQISS